MPNPTTVRSLFSSELNRKIEKVITYQNRAENQLKTEISEYVVTEHIADNFEQLLKKMQEADSAKGSHEIGVWVSGFYGSGKSSFTKYLGFSFDPQIKVAGEKFVDLLKNQVQTSNATKVRALLNTVASGFNAEIIFLDLASEMLAGSSLEDISTVLYLKVLQWAGYSEDLKVAELERMLEKDGKLADFEKRASQDLDGVSWKDVHNQPLVANPIAARLASVFYPNLFKSAADFQQITLDVKKSEIKRTEEMIELIQRKSKKQRVLFIIDEVGQYVSAKPNLILNLDGLAKNLKHCGNGKVWIFATAQQTLTEDTPSAMLNAPGLFKLKDRFPIQIHLEATDIKEICHKRLLTKSKTGEDSLSALFERSGPQLRTATKLADAGVYEASLDKTSFVNLYPFLPAHFEILIQLLTRLARKTGGLGLRSAIKVLQDVLVERGGRAASDPSLADAPFGSLATTVTFYDSLRRDIQSSFGFIVEGVKKVEDRFSGKPNATLAVCVAKTIGILQILENLPVNETNIAALMQSSVEASSKKEDVKAVLAEMLKDNFIPLGEKNGSLRFLTQAAVTLQKQFDGTEYRSADIKAEQNATLKTLFSPLPSTRLNNVRPVSAGIRTMIGGGQWSSLEGEREPIQIHVEFVPSNQYEATRFERENDSRHSNQRKNIYLLARLDQSFESLCITLVRCKKFSDSNRNSNDSETQDYLRLLSEKKDRTLRELENKLRTALQAGSFIAHGSYQSVSEINPLDFGEACRGFLSKAAERVFEKYSEASLQAEAGLAEKLLSTPLDRITSADDPLNLISRVGGRPSIKADHKALVSLKEYLNTNGQVEGRKLLEFFSEPPFGWSKDTTRYLLAALLISSDIKLRIAGQEHSVKNDETLQAFSSNRALSVVGLSLREGRPDPAALGRASDRIRDLTGEDVHPLEDVVCAAVKKHFPAFQQGFVALVSDLQHLKLPGAEKAEGLSDDLANILQGDGSAAIAPLGAEDSQLFESLQWAKQVQKAFRNGLKKTISDLQLLQKAIRQLPNYGAPGNLRLLAKDRLDEVQDILARDSFYDQASVLAQAKTELDKQVADSVVLLASEQAGLVKAELEKWQNSSEWVDLTQDDRTSVIQSCEAIKKEAEGTLEGLGLLIAHSYDLNEQLRLLRGEIEKKAKIQRDLRSQPSPAGEKAGAQPEEAITEVPLLIPETMEGQNEVHQLIEKLQHHRNQILAGKNLRLITKLISTKKS